MFRRGQAFNPVVNEEIMRTLEKIQADVLSGSQEVMTDGEKVLGEILWEILQRIDKMMFVSYSSIEVLDHIVQINITTVETLIYQNMSNKMVTLKLYNTDPAQTVHIGKQGVTVSSGAPLFHEQAMPITVNAGDSIYGIVELGTVDIRYSVYTFV